MAKRKWTRHRGMFGSSNSTLDGDGFYISYNPTPGTVISSFGSDGGSAETALCHNGEFYILNGDYRSAYERLIDKGFDACKAFYDETKDEARSSWSTDYFSDEAD